MTDAGPVLVVGSYPPIPVPGAMVSLAEVRRAWADGEEVVVAAPRLCAAHLTVPVAGLLAGRRLANLGRVTGARRLVLVMEKGYPMSLPAPLMQIITAALVVRAFAGFDHVRLIVAGDAGISPSAWARLRGAATETVEVEAEPAAPGVTPMGPPEETPAERARRMARRGGQRVLGARGQAAYRKVRALTRRS